MVPTLTDGEVLLRAHRPDDVQGCLEQSLDPESQRWTTVPVPYRRADAEHFLTQVVPSGWADDSEWAFALEAEGRYAGTVSLRNLGGGRAEIAYGAHPWARGRGYVERGLRLLLDWGFGVRDVRTVIWWAHVGNWASRRLAWRLGFTVEGTVRDWQAQRGGLRTSWVGTLLREDPRGPRTSWLANPVVEGDGVRLRPFTGVDVPRVVEGLGDRDTQHWLAFMPREPAEADGWRYLEQVQERLATGHTVTWAWSAADDDRLLGVVGIYRVPEEAELGYWTHPDARGRGLTVRAARLAVTHAFGTLGLDRLAAYVSAPNVASRGVLEALGMQPTGLGRRAAQTGDGAVVDVAGYDLLATEWGSPA